MHTSEDRPASTARVAGTGDVVLVNPAMTGRGFKAACRDRGFRVVSLYTLRRELLTGYDPDYAAGDDLQLYAPDASTARRMFTGRVRAVVPTTEPSVVTADQLSQELGVPGNPVATALARRDKVTMRRHAAGRGLRVPDFAVVRPEGIEVAAERIGYPAIKKPATGAGSHGVTLLRDRESLAKAPVGAAEDLFGNPLDEWLVESYVRGRELAVNAFTVDGRHRVLDIWEYRQPSAADYDQPYWDVVQLPPGDPDWERSARFVEGVLDAFEVRLGPSHTEIKIDDRGPCLIELATRLPGIHMTDHWAAHSAIAPFADTLSVYLGEDPGILERDLRLETAMGVCCIRNDQRAGTLRAVEGLDEVARMPGVDAIHPHFRPGDEVPLTGDLGSLVAAVLVSAPDLSSLDQRLSEVRSTVKLELL